MNRLFLSVRDWIRGLTRSRLKARNRKRLRNFNPTVLSANCVGAVICHDLGLRFNSPTVNLYMIPSDFIKFLDRLDHYLEADLVEISDIERTYPVGALDDLVLHFVHYESFQEAKLKWDNRVDRVDLSNAYVMMVERDGCTEEDIKRFDSLPYPNKVIFVSKEMPEIASAVHLPGTTINGEVDDLCRYTGKISGKRAIDSFDYVSFFNQGH